MALEANFCRVELEQPGPGGIEHLLCVRRTRLGKTGQQICVGDRVQIDGIDWPEGRGAVAALEPRNSLLERPAVANCSRVVVAVALEQPQLDPLQLTRFLITAERTGVAVELVLTKADLLRAAERAAWCERLQGWGYGPLLVSAPAGRGDCGVAAAFGPARHRCALRPLWRGEKQLDQCPGAGACLAGECRIRPSPARPPHHPPRGAVSLVPGALLADTPGFNRPDLPLEPGDLGPLFPEIRQRLVAGVCRFKNCLHQGDPGCAVGSDWDRFPIYTTCLEAVQAQAAREQGRSIGSAGLKQRGSRREPLLDQRLRQVSRRRQRQSDVDDD